MMPSTSGQARAEAADAEEAMETEKTGAESSDEEGTTFEGVYVPPPPRVINLAENINRIIITKITIHGFKSYGQEQVLGPFHKCFNAVVGPNGSGKSNVIDAILFVFGYRAKRMRSKNVSVLVHMSKKFPNCQSCKVSVHFAQIVDKDDSDDYEVIPNSDFIVSRIGNRDNSSYYELDGRKVQFKEVAHLLRKHGIDLDHNRFLILQGEVEQISMMKCKGTSENETGMLEYLEDIIGTSRYKRPIDQLSDKLDVLTEEKLRRSNRMKIVEIELENLKEPMQDAIKYMKSENKVVTLKNLLYQQHIFDTEDDLEEQTDQLNKVLPEYQELIAKLEDLTRNKTEKDQILKKETKALSDLKNRQSKLKLAFEKADKKDVQLQADMTQVNTNRKKFKSQLEQEKTKLLKLRSDLENNEKTLVECENLEQGKTIERAELEQSKKVILDEISNSTADLQLKKKSLETDLEKLQESVNETKKTFGTAEKQLTLLYSNEQNEVKKLEQFKSNYDSCEEEFAEKTRLVAEHGKKLPNLKLRLETKIKEAQNLRKREALLLNDLKSKRMTFEENRSNLQASKSKSRVLDALIQEKRQGKCPGLYGRLGDLGAIDKKHDVAISTACGPLDNIVVDSVDTAQYCIEFLKRHDIGRATFIALEKQEHLRNLANSKIQTPENVARLFDLIQIQNDDVRTAFYYALGDTLLAHDLDQATRIGYGSKRYRVVTLRGDLIETSGIMSGGGNTVIRGRMGQSVQVEIDPATLKSMENDLNRLENELATLRTNLERNETEIAEIQPILNEMKLNHQKYTEDLKSLQQQLPQLQQQLNKQQDVVKKCKVDENKVQVLSAEVASKKKVYDEAQEKADKLQKVVDQLSEEIHSKTLGKTKAINEKLSQVNQSIDKCQKEITRLKVALKSGEKNLKIGEVKITNFENEIESAVEKIQEMRLQREEIESDAKQLLTCLEKMQGEIETVEENYNAIKSDVQELNTEENSTKKKKLDLDQVVKRLNQKIDTCNADIHQLHAQLKHLKLQSIPGEDLDELKKFSREELSAENFGKIKKELTDLGEFLKSTTPNMAIIDEYKTKMGIHAERCNALKEVMDQRERVRNAWNCVKNRRREEFMAGYSLIKLKLKEIYQSLSIEGDADLELVDSFDPFCEGVQLNIRPPKKTWKKITQLSGGEKTLSSLALVFALHYYKPSPLYIMDEIDAALDFKNVAIVGQYVKRHTKNAQFIIISLRTEMCELCDNFIGIYKPDNFTLTICFDPKAIQK